MIMVFLFLFLDFIVPIPFPFSFGPEDRGGKAGAGCKKSLGKVLIRGKGLKFDVGCGMPNKVRT